MGWHRNRGADQAAELIDAGQLGEVFRRPDLVALALEGLDGHGVFTYVLLEGLAGRADLLGDRDGTIETAELADYLEKEVPQLSRRVWQYEQYPMRELHGQSFPIGLRSAGR